MIRHIPSKETRRWTGPYPGNHYGSLWKTFNVDLDRNEGMIGLSQKMGAIEDTTEIIDLSGFPVKVFLRTDADCTDRYWALNSTALFKTDSAAIPDPADDWDTDALDSSPTSGLNDMSVHGNDSRNDSGRNKLFVTTDSDVAVLNDTGNNAWTRSWWVTKQSQPQLDTSVFHPIEYFPNRKITLIGDRNLVHTISRPSDTQNDTIINSRLILPADYVVRHIFTTSERAWICCYNRKIERGAIAEWDGFSQSANRIHEVYSMGVIAGVNYGGQPIVLDNKGAFLEYTSAGFIPMRRNDQEVALFSRDEPGRSLTQANEMADAGDFSVHWKGMAVGEDGLIYINFPGSFNGGYGNAYSRLAGIWCLNPITGRLYSKYSLGIDDDSSDFGQQIGNPNLPGGLFWVSSDVQLFGRNLLAGGVVASQVGSPRYKIWLLDDFVNGEASRGHFITQYIPADEIREFWDTLWVKFKKLKTLGNSIVVKARGTRTLTSSDGSPVDVIITWTSTTTFTADIGGANDDAISIGDEIETLEGVDAGRTFHISSISGAHGAVQTFTVDEAAVTGSGTSTARFDRWKKIGTITSTSVQEQKMNIGIDSSFIQFKVELRGTIGSGGAREIEVSELVVVSKPSTEL